MEETYQKSFGLLIAFVLPGFVCLAGLSAHVPALESWLALNPQGSASVGGFLNVLLASIGMGLSVSAVRWAVVDTIHHRTGLPLPEINFARIESKVSAYLLSVEYSYRYYQHFAGLVLAVPFFWINWRIAGKASGGLSDVGILILEIIYFANSRNCLDRYYTRLRHLLGTTRR